MRAPMYLFQAAASSAARLSFLKWTFRQNSHAERERGEAMQKLRKSAVFPSKALGEGKHKSGTHRSPMALSYKYQTGCCFFAVVCVTNNKDTKFRSDPIISAPYFLPLRFGMFLAEVMSGNWYSAIALEGQTESLKRWRFMENR